MEKTLTKAVVMKGGKVICVKDLNKVKFEGSPNFLVVDGARYMEAFKETREKTAKEIRELIENFYWRKDYCIYGEVQRFLEKFDKKFKEELK